MIKLTFTAIMVALIAGHVHQADATNHCERIYSTAVCQEMIR